MIGNKFDVLIYSLQDSPRLRYALEVLFGCVRPCQYKLTSSVEEALAFDGPVIDYSGGVAHAAIQIPPNQGLFENTINPDGVQRIANSETQTDWFWHVFYLASRYEEYVHASRLDVHGRFIPLKVAQCEVESTIPEIHRIGEEISKLLESKGYTPLPTPGFRYKVSLDIDNAFAFSHKGPSRWWGAMVREIGTGGFNRLVARLSTLVGQNDPYDQHTYLIDKLVKQDRQAEVFWLVGQSRPYDRPVSITHPAIQKVIRQYANAGFTIGLHPSYAGGQVVAKVVEERKQLENVLGQPIVSSRHHYLRHRYPHTPRLLIEAGIVHDHTLGWADRIGWRGGVAVPIPFYDLERDEQTSLWLHPFYAMDVRLAEEPYLIPTVHRALAEARKGNYPFTLLAHNEFLSKFAPWGVNGLAELIL